MATNRAKISANVSKLLSQGKYDKAIGEMQKLIDEEPTDFRTLLRMAETFSKMGRPVDAIQTYENVANQYTADGFHMKAIAVYKQMLRVDNNMTDAHKALAEQYQALGMQKDSLRHYEIVATLFERGGRLQEALGIFRRMAEQQPDDLNTRVRLADYLAKQRMTEDAAREYQAALEIASRADLSEDYIAVAEKQLLVDSSNIELNRNLARRYLSSGDPQKALVKIQQCFNLAPKDLETLPLVAEVFESLGQINKATAVHKEMGRLYSENGQIEHATASWKKVLSVIPNDQDALNALGTQATTVQTPAVPTVSETPIEVMKEIDVFLTYGLKDKAVVHLQNVLKMYSDDLDLHTRLVELLEEKNDKEAWRSAAQARLEVARRKQDGRAEQWAQMLATSQADDENTLGLEITLDLDETKEVAEISEIHMTAEVDPIQVSVAEVLAQFKQGVQQNVQEEDADTHFELGIAYKEMGLLNEAKDSFQLAAKTSSKRIDAQHMIALILMDEGHASEALAIFDDILKESGLNASQKGANYFHKGLCHQRLNQKTEAYLAYQAAAKTGEVLPGLKERLAVLSKK